jgi:hypothetical protein
LEYDFEDEFVDFAEIEYWPSSSTSTSNDEAFEIEYWPSSSTSTINDEDFNENVVDDTVMNSPPRVAPRDTKN